MSWPTAAKALTTLQSEGLVRGVVGVGTVVCAGVTAHNSSLDRLRSIWATGRIYPPNERAAIKSASLVPAPPEIADALGLAPGTYVIRRHRVTYRDDVPISASVTWLDGKLAAVAPRLLTTERICAGDHRLHPRKPPAARWPAASTRTRRGRRQSRTPRTWACRSDHRSHAAGTGGTTRDDVVIEYGERVSIPGRWSTHEYATA